MEGREKSGKRERDKYAETMRENGHGGEAVETKGGKEMRDEGKTED